MGRHAEELHLLDAFGIVTEAFDILLCFARSKLLWAVTLSLLLPLSFGTLGLNFISGCLLLKINDQETYYKMEANSVAREKTLRELTSEWKEFFVFVAAYGSVVLILRMLSTAAVVYTVASSYNAHTKNLKLSYARIMSVHTPRVWKRLTITFLLVFIISFAVCLLAMILLLIIFFSADRVEANNKLKSGSFFFGLILVILFVCLELYISTVWNLASVVTVLDERYYGIDAVQRSSDLMKGKRATVLPLIILYFILNQVIVRVFWYAVVEGRGRGVGTAARAVYGVLLVGLLCFVILLGLLTQTVSYFVCKSYHHDSTSHNSTLQVLHVGDYGPFDTNGIHLDHADV